MMLDKTQIKDDSSINTVANIFLAQGGDGFDTFKEVEYEVVMGDLEAFEKYTEKFSKKDNNNNGTLGLNKIDVKNPNIINLDQDFDGKIDNPEDLPENDDSKNGKGNGDNKSESNNEKGNGDNKSESNNGNGNSNNSGKSNKGNINNPITGDSSILGYVAVGMTAAVGLVANTFRRKRK